MWDFGSTLGRTKLASRGKKRQSNESQILLAEAPAIGPSGI